MSAAVLALHTAAFWLRKRLPQPVRTALRVFRYLRFPPPPSPVLPQSLFADCRMSSSRYDLVTRLPQGAEIAEIGVHRGDFARHILQTCHPKRLVLVDLDLSLVDPIVTADPRVEQRRGYSHQILASFADASFDWIYIDADHSYEGCKRDALAAAAKVKPGGHLVFNDFAHLDSGLGVYGVHRAVVEFAAEQGWPFVRFAYDPAALYDVALQRPLEPTP